MRQLLAGLIRIEGMAEFATCKHSYYGTNRTSESKSGKTAAYYANRSVFTSGSRAPFH